METTCKYCGTQIIQTPKQKTKYYCNDKCRCAYLYENRDETSCPPERISKCVYCGVEFDNWRNLKRKYCCHAHYTADRFGITPAKTDRSGLLGMTMQMHADGVGYGTIAKEIDVPRNTVKSWVRRHGNKYFEGKEDCPTELTADGTPLLRETIEVHELPQNNARRIFLLCGASRFTGKFDNFAAQIPQMLAYNLQAGDVFVFCNKSRYQLSVLQWQGDGFALMFRRTERERYPWPFSAQPKAVEVSRSDLEMLLEYPRFMRRLRGLATPEPLT